ncbi:VOC family protein [Cellulophaga baltica]|uniref:Glyoxylase I family protein n=1 Tax=Cellulophaga baltica TaxID=76594 RepID=A0A1G7LM76_9FLAO|nr:VOC family protein [Cellulophaga baltica]SDF50595.1 glyoxylase I family protein [Cellulophaga baltica]
MENKIRPLSYSDKNTASQFKDLKAGHVAIRTTEYDAIIKWYKDKLDFRLIREWEVGEIQLAFIAPPNDNNFLIEILGVKGIKANDYKDLQIGYDHLCFNVENLELTLKELSERNVIPVRCFKVPAIGKSVAFFSDPFGNTIELSEDII